MTVPIRAAVPIPEVVQSHLDRIDEMNGEVNAVVARFNENALAATDRADESRHTRGNVGPLHGVSMSVKINLDIVWGSPATRAFRRSPMR